MATRDPTGLDTFRLKIINNKRTAASVDPLVWNGMLARAADWGNQWMLQRDRFEHHNEFGRIFRSGWFSTTVGTWSWGENIAWRSRISGWSAKRHVIRLGNQLFNSDEHRGNMLNPVFSQVGISIRRGGFAPDGTAFDAYLITEIFGEP